MNNDIPMDSGYFYAPYPDLPIPTTPPWACPEFGNYEHDWLDCPDCLDGYEKYLEEDEGENEDEGVCF